MTALAPYLAVSAAALVTGFLLGFLLHRLRTSAEISALKATEATLLGRASTLGAAYTTATEQLQQVRERSSELERRTGSLGAQAERIPTLEAELRDAASQLQAARLEILETTRANATLEVRAKRVADLEAIEAAQAGDLQTKVRELRALAEDNARVAAEVTQLRIASDDKLALLKKAETADAAQRAELQARERELRAFAEANARVETELAQFKLMSEDKLALLQRAEANLRDAFSALSSEALHQNSQSFLELAATRFNHLQDTARQDLEAKHLAIDTLLAPMKSSLEKVDGTVREIERERVKAHAELNQQLAVLAVTQSNLQSETSNLVRALRNPSSRGRWGELQLRRVVELAGMVDRCDFVEQISASGEDGLLRPDLIVRLPGNKQIVVDSKAPFSAYVDALEEVDEVRRKQKQGDYSRRVREHIAKLSDKAYWRQFQPTPEFVVMFLPGETFFSAAIEEDPGLIEFSADLRVVPASPTTLIALLKAVAYGWQQENMAENAEAISRLGRALYDRLRILARRMDDMGRALSKTVDHYNQTVGSFEGRVLVAARRFQEMGVGSTEAIEGLHAIDRSPRFLAPIETDEEGDDAGPDSEPDRNPI